MALPLQKKKSPYASCWKVTLLSRKGTGLLLVLHRTVHLCSPPVTKVREATSAASICVRYSDQMGRTWAALNPISIVNFHSSFLTNAMYILPLT